MNLNSDKATAKESFEGSENVALSALAQIEYEKQKAEDNKLPRKVSNYGSDGNEVPLGTINP